MREGIHPEYPAAAIACACGNKFITKSTRGDFSIDVCSACHPFYTGTQKLMDTAGRVDRFRKRYGAEAKVLDTKTAAAAAQAKSEAVEKTAKEKKPKKAAAEASPATADASATEASPDASPATPDASEQN